MLGGGWLPRLMLIVRRVPPMSINRAASAVVAGGYLVYAFSHFSCLGALKFTVGLVLPLLCIWFSDQMGAFTGWLPWSGITSSSPPRLLCVLGWVVLLIPAMLWIVYAVSTAA